MALSFLKYRFLATVGIPFLCTKGACPTLSKLTGVTNRRTAPGSGAAGAAEEEPW
jgi:hypothetical protein